MPVEAIDFNHMPLGTLANEKILQAQILELAQKNAELEQQLIHHRDSKMYLLKLLPKEISDFKHRFPLQDLNLLKKAFLDLDLDDSRDRIDSSLKMFDNAQMRAGIMRTLQRYSWKADDIEKLKTLIAKISTCHQTAPWHWRNLGRYLSKQKLQ